MWRKIIVPKFNGANDPKAYLAWEMKLDKIFNSYDYKDNDKVLMASLEFEGYAMNWWNQITMDIARRRQLPIFTLEQLKVAIKEIFVPPYYKKEIFNKLQRLTQGNKSVEEYVQEMEVTLMKSEVEETTMATMARFLNGLNREIQDVGEMHHYETLEDLIHQATKVEKQLKRRNAYRKSSPHGEIRRIIKGRKLLLPFLNLGRRSLQMVKYLLNLIMMILQFWFKKNVLSDWVENI